MIHCSPATLEQLRDHQPAGDQSDQNQADEHADPHEKHQLLLLLVRRGNTHCIMEETH